MPTETEYEALIRRADLFYVNGEYDEAEALVREGVEQAEGAGDDAFVYCLRGLLGWHAGDVDRYLLELEQAAHVLPESPLINVEFGAALSEARRYDEALATIDEALKLRPDYFRGLFFRAVCLMNLARYAEALEATDKAIALEPGNMEAVRTRAITLAQMGRRPEAVRELRSLLDKNPNDRIARQWLFRFEDDPERAGELERERKEDERRRVQEEREREIKMDAWRKLSARTAHRIDNQLFAARGAMRTVKAQDVPELAEPIEDMDACLDRMGSICAEFRRFSTERPPKFKPVDARLLIEDVVRRYAKSAEGIDVQTDVAPLLPECRWDAHQIDQALSELMENAIRHAEKAKRIEVSAQPIERSGKQHVRIVLANYGKGIDAKHKARLFDPFFTLRSGATGLGLAIVSQTIKNHGGSIRETGEPERFARFEIDLPARQDEGESS